MAKVYKDISEIIGNTPLVELKNFNKNNGIKGKILAKLEFYNPAGSIKDRVAFNMIKDAEDRGLLNNKSVIIEPTSGNTGIGLAAISAAKGYRVILTMPETMSIERRNLLAAYGAEIVLTEGGKGMQGAVDKANELEKEIDGGIILGQFTNPANPQAHYLTTGPEIWEATEGNVDILVAGIGTGGTISGTGKYLKENNPNIKIVGVEPETSPVLTKGYAGGHKIQGIGANFVPETLDTEIYDEIITVNNEVCFEVGREISRSDGILVGISAGAALWAAKEIAQREENKNKTIVVIFPDSGDRYMSTPLFG